MSTTPARKRFGKWIKKTREGRDLSQSLVAEKVGYDSGQFVSNWERGLSLPPDAVAAKLAKALGLPYRVLLDEIYATKQRDLKAAHKAAMKKGV